MLAFIPIPKKDDAKECSHYHTIMLILHGSKFMLKIFQARLQQCMNQELTDAKTVFKKGEGIKDQIVMIRWIIEKAREFQKKTSTSVSLTMLKHFTVWITTNWKILQEMGLSGHPSCLLRNLYVDQEATVRTRH